MLGVVGALCRSGMASLQIGEHVVAERVLCHALDVTRSSGLGPILEAKAINNLGLVFHACNRVSEAKRYYLQALQLIDGRLGKDNWLYRSVMENYRRIQ